MGNGSNGTSVQSAASLHEKAVQAVAVDALPLPRARRASVRRKQTLSVTSVHPLALRAAQRLLQPSQRLVIVSATEVLIVNR